MYDLTEIRVKWGPMQCTRWGPWWWDPPLHSFGGKPRFPGMITGTRRDSINKSPARPHSGESKATALVKQLYSGDGGKHVAELNATGPLATGKG
jgi:hypothetical protein